MANPDPLSFFGNIQWKIVKQFKSIGFYSILHKASVTTNLFQFLKILAEICYTWNKVFSLILVWLIQIHHHFLGSIQWKIVGQFKTSDLYSIF